MPGPRSAPAPLGDRGVRTDGEHLSDLALERWVAGELANDAGAPAHHHLARCAECQARLRHRSEARSTFARRADLAALAEATWRRAGRAPSSRRRRLLALGAVTAVAGVAVAIPTLLSPRSGERLDGLRAKGSLALELFVRHPDGAVTSMAPDGAVAGGDQLRFRVVTPREGFVAIVSVDGAGQVSSYLPAAGSLPAVGAGAHLLDGAVELDDVLGHERLLAFLCAEPLDGATVREGVRAALKEARGDPTQLDSSLARLPCTFTSFRFRKVPRS